MKKIFNSILVIAAAAAVFASCQKNEVVPSTTKTVNFTATTVDTKAAFGTPEGLTYPTLWTSNDKKVKISLNFTEAKNYDLTPASDGKSATFSGKFEENEESSYIFTAISPVSAFVATSSSDEDWTIEIPGAQTPSATSVDEAAMILSAAYATNTLSETIEMAFQHVTAYGVFNLTNLTLGDAVINSVSLTAEKPISGRFFYYPTNGDFKVNSGANTITINTSSTENIWFACAPCELGGTTLKVVVSTNKGTFTKNATIPVNKFKFESGVIGKFNIDMSGIALEVPKVYTKVTDLDELTDGSKVIIVANAYDYALSTQQNKNNRGQASVTKSENKILDPAEDVQIITLEAGKVTNSIALNTGAGYLAADGTGTNNYLHTLTALDKFGSFKVSISEGLVTLMGQGGNERNTIMYNSSNKMFSAYGSGQEPINLYKLEGSGNDVPLVTEEETISYVFDSLADLCAAELASGTEVTVTLTDEEIVDFYQSSSDPTKNNGIFLMVGTQKIEIYKSNVPSTWEIGGLISGTVTCPWELYNGIWELKPTTWDVFEYTAPVGDDDYSWPNPVTFNFGDLLSLKEWTNDYLEHTVDYKECTVTFSSANKQNNTITDAPVTKGQPVTVVMKDGKKIKSLELVCEKWAAKAQTITLNVSKDGGKTFTATNITSSDFDLVANELEEGVNAVKFTFSSSKNQIGICSLQIKY